MEKLGLRLSQIDANLVRVAKRHEKTPIDSFDFMDRVGARGRKFIQHYNIEGTPRQMAARIDLEFMDFSVDEFYKIRFSDCSMLPYDQMFRKEPYRVIHKIENSSWRWGLKKPLWNELVDSYEGLRDFTLNRPDFECRLDYTTGWNERGYSEYSRTFLDGVFGFLVLYRGEHVMTLGFSFTGNRQILLQQVQLKKPKSNRWLYRLPQNYLEFVIERFITAFPNHTLRLADPNDVLGTSLLQYDEGVKYCQKRLETDLSAEERDDFMDRLKECIVKQVHLREDLPRLRAFYNRTGRFKMSKSKPFEANGIKHYRIAKCRTVIPA